MQPTKKVIGRYRIRAHRGKGGIGLPGTKNDSVEGLETSKGGVLKRLVEWMGTNPLGLGLWCLLWGWISVKGVCLVYIIGEVIVLNIWNRILEGGRLESWFH